MTSLTRSTGLTRRIGSILVGIAAILVFAASVFPVYWMVNTSFQPNSQVRGSELHFWPDNGTLENYANVIFDSSRAPFPPALANSLAVTLITVVVSLVFAFLAALAVTRFRFRSRGAFIITILIIQMIPAEAMTLPVWLRTFLDPNGGINWAELMAGSTLVAIPVVIFFLIVQTRMTSGLVAGAVKG